MIQPREKIDRERDEPEGGGHDRIQDGRVYNTNGKSRERERERGRERERDRYREREREQESEREIKRNEYCRRFVSG